MKPLRLASRSPARAKLLRDAGLQIECVATAFDEAGAKRRLAGEPMGAPNLAGALARGKALGADRADGRLVLGADQVLEMDGRLFDKPDGLDDLRAQLRQLAGRTHVLHSAAVLARDGRPVWAGSSRASLTMRPLSDALIERYVEAEGEHALGCVGGYRLEAAGVQLFEAVEGDYFAVLGLPLLGVLRALRDLGELT